MSKFARGTAVLGLSASLVFGVAACSGDNGEAEPSIDFTETTYPVNTFREDCGLAIAAAEGAYVDDFGAAWDAVSSGDERSGYYIDDAGIRQRVADFVSTAALAFWSDDLATIEVEDLDSYVYAEFLDGDDHAVAIELESFRRRNDNLQGLEVLQARSDELDVVLQEAWQASDGGQEFCGTNPDIG